MLSSCHDNLLSTRAVLLLSVFNLILSSVHGQNIPEIKANYGSAPAPFTIDVDPSFIATTKLKVSLSRVANDIGVPNLVDGPSTEIAASTKDFWVKEYDWRAVQRELNEKYKPATLLFLKLLIFLKLYDVHYNC